MNNNSNQDLINIFMKEDMQGLFSRLNSSCCNCENFKEPDLGIWSKSTGFCCIKKERINALDYKCSKFKHGMLINSEESYYTFRHKLQNM